MENGINAFDVQPSQIKPLLVKLSLSPIPEIESNFCSWQIELVIAFEP